jgi:hypothetical protein
MAVDIVEDLLEKGVCYVVFCFDWFRDNDCCEIIDLFDENYQLVSQRTEWNGKVDIKQGQSNIAVEHELVWTWQRSLANHVFVYENKLEILEDLRGMVLLYNVLENEVTPVGQKNHDTDYPSFFYCPDIKAMIQGLRSQETLLLRQLACHPEEYVRLCVAKNPNTPKAVLEDLMGDLSFTVSAHAIARAENKSDWEHYTQLLQEARNKLLSSGEIQHAIQHGYWRIRWSKIQLALLEQPKINDASLMLLAEHFDWEIQLEVFCHPKASEATKTKALEKLITSSVNVQMRLAEHRKSPPELLEALEKVVQDESVLARIALHPNNNKRSRFVD